MSARQPVEKKTIFTEKLEPGSVPGEANETQAAGEELTAIEQVRERLRPYDFWQKMRQMTKDDWNHSEAYLYRHKGQQTEQTDKPPRGQSWLDKFGEPFTIDYVKEHHGGGYFWAIVNYDGTFLASLNFRIEGDPIYLGAAPPAATGDQKTDFLIGMLKDLIAEVKAGHEKPDDALARAIDVMSKANDVSTQMMLKQLPEKVDPMTQLKNMADVLEKLRPTPPPGPATNPQTSLKEAIELLDSLGMLNKPSADPVGGLGKTLEALRSFGVIPGIGGGGTGGKEDWKVAMAGVLPEVLKSVEGIATRIVQGISAARQPSPVQAAQMAAAQPRPGATIVGEHRSPNAAPGQPAPASATPGAPPTEAQQIQQVQATVESWLWMRVCELMKAGTRGDDVALFLQHAAPEAATFFGAQTPEQLEQLISSHPILQQVAGHPRLKAFLEEFHSYFTEDDTGEPDAPPDAK
jgi:hypothetical protein